MGVCYHARRRGAGTEDAKMDDRTGDSAENRALERARAALDAARRVMDAGAAKGPPPPPVRSRALTRARRAQTGGVIACAVASVLLIVSVGYYRIRVTQMARDVSELSAMVAAAKEQRKEAERLQARRVEELTRELAAMKQTAEKPRRAKILWIF